MGQAWRLIMSEVEIEQAIHWLQQTQMESFYWWVTSLMLLIHVGFLAYEMGASRLKNTLASGIKNILGLAFVIPTFYFFGWFIYLGFPDGLVPRMDELAAGLPWVASMGPNIQDNASGIFWGAFALFAATTASIFSGAVLERIRLSAFIILAIILGSGVWILAASWGWHPEGWLVVKFGYYDVAVGGVIHMVAGFFALGVLINLGPRIGRFNPDGSVNAIRGHSMPMSLIGLMLIIAGLFGFFAGCAIFVPGGQWETIYGTPTTLSAFMFNLVIGLAGGMIGAYALTRDPFWMMSGGLAGLFAIAAGINIWYPPLAFAIAFAGGMIAPLTDRLLQRLRIDDSVGAVGVHGAAGLFGVLAVGVLASGYPGAAGPAVSFGGQLIGAGVMLLLGFIPGYVISWLLAKANWLRVPPQAEEEGLDTFEGRLEAYPGSSAAVPQARGFVPPSSN
jgi:ammonium transporter, Amt family